MPRAVIDNRGPRIARPGYDANTAPPQHMFFDPSFIAARLYQTGVLTLGEGSGLARFRIASHSFGKTFPAPPIVLVAGDLGGGGADITPWLDQFIPGAGTAQVHPYYTVYVTTTGFTLFVRRPSEEVANVGTYYWGSPATNWRFWVLENTMA